MFLQPWTQAYNSLIFWTSSTKRWYDYCREMQQPPTKRSIYCRLQNMEMKETYNPKIGSPSICAMLAFGWNLFWRRILFFMNLFYCAVDIGPVLKVKKPSHDTKACPKSITQQPIGASYLAQGSLILQFITSASSFYYIQ